MENVREVSVQHLATVVRDNTDEVLIIDSRTFSEYNTSHALHSVNVWSSKIRKKRLQQNAMSVQDYLCSACDMRRSSQAGEWSQIIVYDQSAPGIANVLMDSFLYVLLDRLSSVYKSVHLLIGGFLEFQAQCPDCCEDATQKCSPLTSLSQPCLPVANIGPTRILPFLYLGSQHDANNRQMLQDHCVLYELNVSISCPKPDFVQDSHFLRIPVNDNFSEKLTPYFWDAFNFIDKVRESGGSVLVHCLAGISRSATVAIAFVMKHLHLPYEEAYRYVKNRRPTISPNINFVGQLLELDKHLRREGTLCDPSSAPASFRQTGSSPYTVKNPTPYGMSSSGVGPTPYGSTVTNICSSSNTSSFSLDYSVNNKTSSTSMTSSGLGGVLSDVTSASSYSLSSLAMSENVTSSQMFDAAGPNKMNSSFVGSLSSSSSSCTNQSTTGSNVSLTHITQEPASGLSFIASNTLTNSNLNMNSSNLSYCNVSRPGGIGLYSKSSNISTHFGKGSSVRDDIARHGFSRTGGNIPRSLSLNLKTTLEAVPGSPESGPQTPESVTGVVVPNLNFSGLRSPQSASVGTPESSLRSCESTLHSPNSFCSSLNSPVLSAVQSPTAALSKLSFNSSTDSTCDSRQYSLKTSRSTSLKSLLSAANNNSDNSNKSPTIIEVRKSPTIMENVFEAQYLAMNKRNSSTNYQTQDDESNNNKNYFSSTATISVAASNTCNDDVNSNSSNIDTGGNDVRPRSVCIIEVNTESPVTYVENCSTEPMIVRETEVVATPCTEADFLNRVNNTSSSLASATSFDNNNSNLSCNTNNRINSTSNKGNKEEKPTFDCSRLWAEKQHKTLVPIRASASFANILDRPKVLELCAPIYNVKRPVASGNGATALVVGDCTWQTRNAEETDIENNPLPSSTSFIPSSDASAFNRVRPAASDNSTSTTAVTTSSDATQTSPTPFRVIEKSNTLGVIYDSEGTSVADSTDFNDTASEFSVMQSDSGVSFQTDSDSNMHHPIPRCYSSSETHLNTRRLLESNAAADYATRKSCSNDEVTKSWSLHKPLSNMSSQPLPISRDQSGHNTNNNFGSMNNSNWNYPGELVRCDSWSTSGLGSELSDWESLQEDAISTHCDDAMGPFEAVFSDVFPGEKGDSLSGSSQVYHHVFPQLFRERTDNKCEASDNENSDKKPRHHSFKDPQQRWRQQYKQIPLARPASLPGVMGSYLAQMQPRTESGLSIDVDDAVELRSTSGRGRGGLKRSSGSRDSGTSGCTPLRPSGSSTDASSRDSGTSGCFPLRGATDSTSSIRDSGASGCFPLRPSGSSTHTDSVGGSRDSGASSGGVGGSPPKSSAGEVEGGVRRNDSGYYSITEHPPVRPGRDCSKTAAVRSRDSQRDEQTVSKSPVKPHISGPTAMARQGGTSRKPLAKPQSLAIMTQRPVPYKPQQPSISSLRQQSSPPKSPSPPKALARRHGSPQKLPSPSSSSSSSHSKSPSPQKGHGNSSQKSPSPTKPSLSSHQRSLSPRKPMSPQRHSSPTKSFCTSPQPRIFGASTFYLPHSDSASVTTKASVRKSSTSETSSQRQTSGNLFQKNSSQCAMVVDNNVNKGFQSVLSKSSRSLISSNMSSKSPFSMSEKSSTNSSKSAVISKSMSSFSSNSSTNTPKSGSSSRSDASLSRNNNSNSTSTQSPPSSSSQTSSAECCSPSQDSESPTDTTFFNKSSSLSSRETSVESDTSIVLNKSMKIKATAGSSICTSSSDPLITSASSVRHKANTTEGGGGNTKGTSLGDMRTLHLGDAARGCLNLDIRNPNAESKGRYPSFGDAKVVPGLGDLGCLDRKSPEKRKSRGSSEESKSSEKRRSFDLDLLSLSDENLKKPVSLKTGVRLAQELLQSMESIVSSELSEIRRCTAELSSRYRLKSRQRSSDISSAFPGLDEYNTSTITSSGVTMATTSSTSGSVNSINNSNVSRSGSVAANDSSSGTSSSCSSSNKISSGINNTTSNLASSITTTTPSLSSYRKIKHMSQFYVLPDRLISSTTTSSSTSSASSAISISGQEIRRSYAGSGGSGVTRDIRIENANNGSLSYGKGAGGGVGGRVCCDTGGMDRGGGNCAERCRSEPPFSGDEGLYRAQSCPGLPQPLLLEKSEEHQETVPELRSCVLRLRCERTPPARDKLLNRYSCGTLDTHHQAVAAAPVLDATFESCPDLGTLRGRGCTSDSSSSSSSRSSFSRMLPVS
uniref:protein-tyrosine-phosphatase n=2 Tax=Hirondellea gigas TaxID=1518452 RepID=A0A6A7FSF3_9CRUS